MRNKHGFTLIELLVVVSLSVIIMFSATTVLVTFMSGSVKNVISRRLKNEGDFALNQMKSQLLNAIELVPNSDAQICEMGMDKIALRDFDNQITEFLVETDPSDGKDKIAANSGNYLLSGDAELVNSALNFDCVSSPEGTAHYVTMSFGLRKGNPGVDRAYEVAQENFTTGVLLRNY